MQPSSSPRTPPPPLALLLAFSSLRDSPSTPATATAASFARTLAPSAMLLLAGLAVLSGVGAGTAAWPALAASIAPVAVAAHDGVADDCFNVYLDVGSNVGIQVRKVFEPELYPHGKVLRFFDAHLGPAAARREATCAFGFEINPLHTSRLLMLQAAYSERGWRTRFFTETGIGLNDTTLAFQSDNNAGDLYSGSRLVVGRGGAGDVQIPVVSLARFVRAILQRHVPPAACALVEPRIVMKLDCEGNELEMLQRLADEGLLCSLAFIYVEFHAPSNLTALRSSLAKGRCKTEIVELDDETYNGSNEPLPGRRL